jgi:hypothetical protein
MEQNKGLAEAAEVIRFEYHHCELDIFNPDMAELSRLGALGWELAVTSPGFGGIGSYIFKRRLVERRDDSQQSNSVGKVTSDHV